MSEYIDRQKALIAINEFYHDPKVDIVLKEIQNAKVRPVVYGKWIPCFEDWRKQIEGDKCSSCGFEHYGTSIKNYNFCPNCGADMRGEKK